MFVGILKEKPERKPHDLRKSPELPNMFGIKICAEMKNLTVALDYCKAPPLKHFKEKLISLSFENLSAIFCQRLYVTSI